MIWYHGTSKECWKKIQAEGVLFGVRGFGANRCTYLAADIQEAKCYGEIVLQVDYDPFRHKKKNNYVDGCWQMRVYEPIPLNKIEVVNDDLDMIQEKNFLAEKPQPVYDENGNVKYYEDDEYIYIRHNGELLDID